MSPRCDHPQCSIPIIKPLNKAHSFLCSKSKHYHNWHHNPHHKKVHASTLIVYLLLIGGLIYNSFPHSVHAAASFTANYNESLNANSGSGGTTASFDVGTSEAALVPGEAGGGDQAAQVLSGQTLKYPLANNLSPQKGEVQVKFKTPYDFSGTDNTASKFSRPSGIDVDISTGTEFLYISDSNNDRIVKTKRDGTQSESLGFSGTGIGQFDNPGELCYDPVTEYIFVTDRANRRIVRTKIDGSGWLAMGVDKFSDIKGLTCDLTTSPITLYAVDSGFGRIARVDGEGNNWDTFSTYGSQSFSNSLRDITYDPASQFLYITGGFSGILKTKWDGLESITSTLGGNASVPWDIYYDGVSGNFFGWDYDNAWYFQSNWAGSNAVFTSFEGAYYPLDIIYKNNTLFIVDEEHDYVVITEWGGSNRIDYGRYGKVIESFSGASDIVYDGAEFYYIADQNNNRVIRTRADGGGWETVGNGMGSGSWQFYGPSGLYYDAANDVLYVADTNNSRIVKLKWDRSLWETYGSYNASSTTPGYFANPRSVYYDAESDRVFVGDNQTSRRVVKFQWSNKAATWDAWVFTSGIGNYQVKNVTDIYYDSSGDNTDLYVLDTSNCRLARMAVWKNTDAGNWATPNTGTTCSNGSRQLSYPKGFYVDTSSGNRATYQFYIADSSNSRVISTKIDGLDWLPATGYSQPQSIYYDGSRLYVTEATRVKVSNWDGSNLSTFNGSNLIKNIIKTDGATPMWLFADTQASRFELYLSYGSIPIKLDTGVQSFSDNTVWHTIKYKYNQQKGTASLYFDNMDTPVDSIDLGASAWSTPALGNNFYIGSDSTLPTTRSFDGVLDNIAISIYEDHEAPPLPTLASSLAAEGGSAINSTSWYNAAHPYFSWTESIDTAENGEPPSGTAGYYVYFGPNSNADPQNPSDNKIIANNQGAHFQPQLNVSISGTLTSGENYLRIKAKDNDNRVSAAATLFTYKYDNTPPLNPASVSVNPASFTREKNFTFSWKREEDEGRSGLVKYQYRVKKAKTNEYVSDWNDLTTIGNPGDTLTQQITIPNEGSGDYQGTNVFYLRAVDALGNTSSHIMTNFLYSGTAPGPVTGLTITSPAEPIGWNADPENLADTNAFSFSWGAPTPDPDNPGPEIDGYRYSVNTLPNINSRFTASTSLPISSYADKQGENILYVVAEQKDTHVLSTEVRSVSFYTNTPAPSPIAAPKIYDISDKENLDWMLLARWSAPESMGSGFLGYTVYRCMNNKEKTDCDTENDYSVIATLTGNGTTYVDAGVESNEDNPYSYLIKARDNAQQFSAILPGDISLSSANALVPTGEYTKPPTLDGDITIMPKSFSTKIEWKTVDEAEAGQITDAKHTAQGFIYYTTNKDDLNTDKASILAEHDSSNSHSINIADLQPETTYFYKLIWKDIDGNVGTYQYKSGTENEPLTFVTDKSPSITSVETKNITLTSANIVWESNSIANSKVSYCVKNSNDCKIVDDNSGANQASHTILIDGLKHTTTYHYEIVGYSEEGKIIKSDGYDFNTLTMPTIVGEVAFDQDTQAPTTTYRFSWKTNVETTSFIYYQSGDGQKQSKSSPEYGLDHSLSVPNLADMSTYSFEVTGIDRNGIQIEAPFKNNVVTPKDSRAPKVSNLTIEVKSSGFGQNQKAQIVATWETDEPSTSQIEYEQGISGTEYKNKSKEDSAFSTSHVVILGELDPSKIYHLRAISKDAAGNAGNSEDTTVITGKMQNSVLDIIVNSLEKSLGWLFTIFKN